MVTFDPAAIKPPEGFGVEDMIALGVSLGVVVFVCVVVIIVLAVHIKKWKTNCRKMADASSFQRTVSPELKTHPCFCCCSSRLNGHFHQESYFC